MTELSSNTNIEQQVNNKILLIIGAGGHGRAIAELALLAGWSKLEFVDDRHGQIDSVDGHPIIGSTSSLDNLIKQEQSCFVAIGNQNIRSSLLEKIESLGGKIISLIHPRAWVSNSATIGAGTAIMSGAVVGTHAKLGKGVIINANATADHDVELGDYAHLGVGVSLAGGVQVHSKAWLQAGCSAGYNVVVPSGSIIPPGAALCA